MRYMHPTQIPRSKTIRSVDWLSDLIRIKDPKALGDTHPMTWAADDEIYIGTGDPQYFEENGQRVIVNYGTERTLKDDLSDEDKWYVYRRITGTCVERLSGTPEDMQLKRINDLPGITGWGGSGAKPTGMISVNGVLYLAMQNLLGWKPPHFGSHCQHGSDVAIICSKDFGKTWQPDLEPILDDFVQEQFLGVKEEKLHHANRSAEWKGKYYERASHKGWTPMFPGDWFGTPSFVQYGKDNADAVDGYVYAVSSDQFDNGTNLRVGRVPNDKIMDADAWEFATWNPDGTVGWTHDLFSSDPMLEIYRHISAPEMVYVPSLKKYLLVTWAHHSDFYPKDGSELTILESDNPWGPYSLVFYEWMWYKQEAGGYCPRIPMKWFDGDKLTGYLEWAGNYLEAATKPYYAPSVRKFQLVLAEEK